MHTQKLPAPIVLIAPSGEDSLLVYTYENILYHYVMSVSNATVTLVQVGQIALHGIIRAPTRVRALSWILPEDQIRESIGICFRSCIMLTLLRPWRPLARRIGCHDTIPCRRQTRFAPADNDRGR
jgi:hypothetical protein